MSDLSEDIAIDLFPRFTRMRIDGGKITTEVFCQYMKERGADTLLSHSVMNHLVNKGFDFEPEKEK